jgi:hypothetical protein
MAHHTMPIPPDQRPKKGPAITKAEIADDQKGANAIPENPDNQGHQGNSKVNTTHQGYQQDR